MRHYTRYVESMCNLLSLCFAEEEYIVGGYCAEPPVKFLQAVREEL